MLVANDKANKFSQLGIIKKHKCNVYFDNKSFNYFPLIINKKIHTLHGIIRTY